VLLSPFTRIFVLFRGGFTGASKRDILETISLGKKACLYPGGVQETLQSPSSGGPALVYTGHCGFIKLSFENKIPVVPVIAIGEEQLLVDLAPKVISQTLYKYFKVPLPCPWYRGLTPPCKVVFGEPLFPANFVSVESMHSAFYEVCRGAPFKGTLMILYIHVNML
jgi:hypothetical protein